MRLCPQCGEGYEGYVQSCPDCNVPLLSEDRPAADAGSTTWPSLLPDDCAFDIFPFEDETEARQALEALGSHGIRAQLGVLDLRKHGMSLFRRDALAVRVPRHEAQRAFELLISELPQVLPQRVLQEVWQALAGQTPELPAGFPPVLAEPLDSLLESGPEIVPDLIRGYLQTGQLGSRCHYVLVHMGADPEPALIEFLTAACDSGEAQTVGKLRFLLTDLAGERSVTGFRGFVEQASSQARQLVAWLLGYIPLVEAVKLLVDLLEDDDLDVRSQAIETLTRLAGTDLGYEPEAPGKERHESVGTWRGFLRWAEREFDFGGRDSQGRE